jgi:ribosomal protein L37AE/L43A
MEPTPLPCPFCGEPEAIRLSGLVDLWMECQRCQATGPTNPPHTPAMSELTTAIAGWNRRAEAKS